MRDIIHQVVPEARQRLRDLAYRGISIIRLNELQQGFDCVCPGNCPHPKYQRFKCTIVEWKG